VAEPALVARLSPRELQIAKVWFRDGMRILLILEWPFRATHA
jgi:hypothetical protein